MDGIARELAYTGRRFDAAECEKEIGLSESHVYDSMPNLRAGVTPDRARDDCRQIATVHPRGIKGDGRLLARSFVADGLNHVATWNAAMLMSDDLTEAVTATMQKRPAKFMD